MNLKNSFEPQRRRDAEETGLAGMGGGPPNSQKQWVGSICFFTEKVIV